MNSRMLPREEWLVCLDAISRQTGRWFVALETYGEFRDGDEEGREEPLRGIDADLNGSSDESITIIFGPKDASLSQRIVGPRRLKLAWNDRAKVEALYIETADGHALVARFRPAAAVEHPQAIRL